MALHKDRHMFPLSLCVARLSGMGSESLFIGVLRKEPPAGTTDHLVIKVRQTPRCHQPVALHPSADPLPQELRRAAQLCMCVVRASPPTEPLSLCLVCHPCAVLGHGWRHHPVCQQQRQ